MKANLSILVYFHTGENIERTDNNLRNYPDDDDDEEINLGEIDEYMDSYYQELKISINKIEVGEITNVAENLDNGGINLSEVDDFLDNYLNVKVNKPAIIFYGRI